MRRAGTAGRVRGVAAFVTSVVLASTGLVVPTLAQAPSAAPSIGAEAIPDLRTLAPDEIEAAIEELLVADLERFGVTAYDPELATILAELRSTAASDLREVLAGQEQPRVPGAVPEPSGEPDAGWLGIRIASISGTDLPTRGGTWDQGGVLLGILGSMSVEASEFIRSVRPGPGSAVIAPPVYEQSRTTMVGGRQVSTQQRIEVRQAIDHATVELLRSMSETYAIPGRDGGPASTVTDSATVRVHMEVCPDANGMVRGRVETASETTFAAPDGPTYHATFEGSDGVEVQVTDKAQVGTTLHTEAASRRATGERPAFGSEPAAETDASLRIASTHATGDGTQPADSLSVLEETGADLADLRIATFVTGLTRRVAEEARDAAATVWQGGRCLRVVASPAGGAVDSGSETPIDVTIEHVVEQAEVPRPVVATLSGSGTIEPSGTPQDAPATVTYRAPSAGGTDTVTFKTTSDRGIAESSASFVVDPTALSGVIVVRQMTTDVQGDAGAWPGDDTRASQTALVHIQLRRQGDAWVDDGSTYISTGTQTMEGGWIAASGDCYMDGYLARSSAQGTVTWSDQSLRFSIDPAGAVMLTGVFPGGEWIPTYSLSGDCDNALITPGLATGIAMICPPLSGVAGRLTEDGTGIRIDCRDVGTLQHGTGLLTYTIEMAGSLRYGS